MEGMPQLPIQVQCARAWHLFRLWSQILKMYSCVDPCTSGTTR